MKNIYIVGFMGTGKTTVGGILAVKLGMEFMEMDEIIEERQGKTINDIFDQNGEAYFRKIESDLLEEISKKSDLVVSCGGGVVCNSENLKLMKNTGFVITLAASPNTTYERTKKDKHRPLLNVQNPIEAIENLLSKRELYYNKAHLIVQTDEVSPQEVADEVFNFLTKSEVGNG